MSVIEKAVRAKLRFAVNGNSTVEDLYDLGTDKLAELGSKLFSQVKEFTEDNPFTTVRKTKAQEKVQLQYDVVKHIYDVKIAEADESANAAAKKAELQQALQIRGKATQEALEARIAKMTDEEFAAYTASLK